MHHTLQSACLPACLPPACLCDMQVWLRFPAASSVDFNELWGVFLPAVQPLVPRLAWEASAFK